MGSSSSHPLRYRPGPSAGAWRMAALAGPDPLVTHQRLIDGYIDKVFPKKVTPNMVTDAYVPMMEGLYPAEAAAHALRHPHVDLAAHAVRVRPPELVDDVLQIHPAPSWLASLPGGRVPDRQDFYELVDVPDVRLARWREAVALSERLGQALLDDIRSGAWAERLESFG